MLNIYIEPKVNNLMEIGKVLVLKVCEHFKNILQDEYAEIGDKPDAIEMAYLNHLLSNEFERCYIFATKGNIEKKKIKRLLKEKEANFEYMLTKHE